MPIKSEDLSYFEPSVLTSTEVQKSNILEVKEFTPHLKYVFIGEQLIPPDLIINYLSGVRERETYKSIEKGQRSIVCTWFSREQSLASYWGLLAGSTTKSYTKC